jgi:hypothetical protein
MKRTEGIISNQKTKLQKLPSMNISNMRIRKESNKQTNKKEDSASLL